MHEKIQQIFLIFFIFPATIHSKNSCPSPTACPNSSLPINYPFNLQTDQPPKHCHNYIDLKCNDQGLVTITLPSYGDFHVTYIDYASKSIALTDPGNCLLGRLMTSSSVYPLDALFNENYTYYNCPKERIKSPLSEIQCLSNSVNATIAVRVLSSEFVQEVYGCEPIVSALIPVSSSIEYNSYSGNFGHLQLTWNVTGCKECEVYGLETENYSGDSESKLAKLFRAPLMISSTVIIVTFFLMASLLHLTKLVIARANTDNTTTTITTENAATAPPQATEDPPAAPPQTISEVKNLTEVVLPSGLCCSICLEEYHEKDRVKNLVQCGHFFHAECIDEWLQKSATCPVCRTSLSIF